MTDRPTNTPQAALASHGQSRGGAEGGSRVLCSSATPATSPPHSHPGAHRLLRLLLPGNKFANCSKLSRGWEGSPKTAMAACVLIPGLPLKDLVPSKCSSSFLGKARILSGAHLVQEQLLAGLSLAGISRICAAPSPPHPSCT